MSFNHFLGVLLVPGKFKEGMFEEKIK